MLKKKEKKKDKATGKKKSSDGEFSRNKSKNKEPTFECLVPLANSAGV